MVNKKCSDIFDSFHANFNDDSIYSMQFYIKNQDQNL